MRARCCQSADPAARDQYGSIASADSHLGRSAVTHSSVSGRLRNLDPVAAKTAFATAGAIGGVPGSPMPVGLLVLGTTCTSTTGIFVHPQQRIVVEVRLLDGAVLDGDLAP